MLDNSNLPRITVVTPSYNQGKFLEETILSVINQNYPNLEYFVIDGGSTDNSIDIIKKYEHRIDWWVSEKDKGQADAIRKGFDKATGDLINWINSDDLLFPNALWKIAEAYKKHPDASFYTGGIAVGSLHDGPIKKCSIPPSPKLWIKKYGIIPIGQQSTFINRKYYKEIGGIDIKYYHRMDGDLYYRLMNYNPTAIVVPSMIGFIRFHNEAKSATAAVLYKKEKEDFIKTLGITDLPYRLLCNLSRFLRIISGNYIRSLIITLNYKGKRMEDIWRRHNENCMGL